MKGTTLAFDFRTGGVLRMRLTFTAPRHMPGKTTENADEFEARFVRLIPDRCVEQAVTVSSDASLRGQARIFPQSPQSQFISRAWPV